MHLCGLGDLAPRNCAWRAKRIACGITVLLTALACTSSSSVSEAACRAAASQCAQQRLSSAAASRSYAALRGKPSAPRMGSRCSISRCEWVRMQVCCASVDGQQVVAMSRCVLEVKEMPRAYWTLQPPMHRRWWPHSIDNRHACVLKSE